MEDERSKKLAAGRDRLAKFQKKKKKKKKEPKSDTFKANGDTSIDSSRSFIEEPQDGGDSVDEFSAGSSDLLGSNSDILSSLSEIDQRSIGTDDLCQDSDTSQLDAEVARVELAEARTRIHQLEESLLGKQTALDLLQNELSQMRSLVNNNTDNSDSSSQNINRNEATTINSSGQEAELRAALEQYSIKIQEFQQALSQRDQVIQQLTVNMQTVVQSRDAVQAEATAQTNQLSQYIQTLQDQLQQTGEALRNQSGEQMSSLADELSMAQSQVTALQQNVADKDAVMQQLADRYAQKAQELIELAEDREELRRKSFGEIAALRDKLKHSAGELTPRDKEDSLQNLQAELEESYGKQIVMMKQQLEEKHKEEVGLWKQRYDEMERIAAASSDSNVMRTELEDQLKEAKKRLGEKDAEITKFKGDIENLTQKLAKVSASHEKQLEELDAAHKNEIDFVKEQAQKRSEEYVNDLKTELSATQDQLNTSLSDLEEEKKKFQEAEDELAEKALNSSSLRDNLTKEIGILAGELQKKDEEIQDLSQVRMTLQDQLNKLTSDQKENVVQLQSQINDLFTENSHLQRDLERLNKEKTVLEETAVDKDAIRSEIEEELKCQYEDQIDELNFAHEALVQQVRNDLIIEHQGALKKMEKDYETKFQQKLENVSVTKQHEFVAELQKVQAELQAKYDQELQEKLEEESAKWSGIGSGPQSGGDQEGGPEVHRLQAELKELSEARDALLTQVDSTTHENEALQEELRHVISEKDTLVEMASSPPEFAYFSSPVEEDQIRKELETLRDCLGRAESGKKNLEEHLSELEDSYTARLAVTESEKQALAEQIKEMQPQIEMVKEMNKLQENLDSMTKHRNQLLTDKEELQHLLETQEKEHESKILEVLMAKEAAYADIEKLKASLEEEKVRVTPDTSAEIGELTETLSELVRLQEKAGKVEMLEAEIQSLSSKLQSLEEHVCEVDGSDSDKLEELQDQLQSQQRLVKDLTGCLSAAENEVKVLRGGSDPGKWNTEIDVLQKELQSLHRERRGDLEAKENLARDLDEKEQEMVHLNDELVNLREVVDRLEGDNKALSDQLSGFEELQSWVETLRNEKVSVEENVIHLNEEVERLKNEVKKREGDISSEKAKNTSLENELERVKGEVMGLHESKEADGDKSESVVELGDGREGGGEVDEDAPRRVESVVTLTQLNNPNEIQEEYESKINRLEKTVEDLQGTIKEMRSVVEEKEKEVEFVKSDLVGNVGEIEDLQRKLNKMEEISSEGEKREASLQNTIQNLERDLGIQREECERLQSQVEDLKSDLEANGGDLAIIQSERDSLLEKVKELEQSLEKQNDKSNVLEENLLKLEREKSSLVERNAILEQEFESDKANIDALIQATLSESERVANVGGDVSLEDEDGEESHEEESGKNVLSTGKVSEESDEKIVDSPKENESSVDEKREEDNKISHLQDEIEDLRERLKYVEKESVREKKEYDKRLVQTEAELMKSQSLRAVLEAQMKAQKSMFDEEVGRLQKDMSSLQGEKEELKDTLGSLKEVVELVPLVQEEVLVAEQVSGESSSLLDLKEDLTSNDVDKEFEKLWQEVGKLKEESKAKEEEICKMEQQTEIVITERDSALKEQEEARTQLKALRESLEEYQRENLDLQSQLASIKEQQEEARIAKESLTDEMESFENVGVDETENEVDHQSGDERAHQQEEVEVNNGSSVREEEILSQLENLRDALEKTQQENLELKLELASVNEKLVEASVTKQIPDNENMETLPVDLKEGGKENLVLKSELASVNEHLVQESVAKQIPDNENMRAQAVDVKDGEMDIKPENEGVMKQQADTEMNDSSLEESDEVDMQLENLRETLEETQRENIGLTSEQTDGRELLQNVNMGETESQKSGDVEEQSQGGVENEWTQFAESEGALMSEIQGLKDELEETKELYSKEKNLLQEALEDEKGQVNSEQGPGAGKLGNSEILRLTRLLEQKEKREKEILTEKNLQISVLQDASVRLEEEKEELLRQLKDLETIVTPTAESKESSSFGKLNELGDDADANLAGRLDASIAREEMLKKEKDLLLEKIAEQEEIHRRLAAEKEELQRQLSDKQRLEELLLEKDRLEQELARQKKNMESELHDIEGQLRQRENHLMREKSQLENELKQKDLLLRRWEVGYREHQLKLRNQEMLLEKQYAEQLSKVQIQFEEGRESHLEKLRSEIEKRHAEAIARLRRDLHQEFALRESRLNESHLSDISLLKSQHNTQLREVLADFEARNEALKQELEAERQKHPGSSNQIDMKELEEKHKEELETLKATAEAVYSSQLDEQLARCERDKAQALVAQLEELQEKQDQEMEKMKKDWEESLAEREEKFQAEMNEKIDVQSLTSDELIGLLQQKLSNEHQEVIEDLSQQLDQTALEYLEALRAKMEDKHREELDLERSERQQQGEVDLDDLKKQWEEEHKLDIEALVAERERVVSQAEEMKMKLETLHTEQLAQLRANMQADFDQLVRAKENLEKTKSQTEQGLKEELEGLRYAFEDLQQKYANEKESAATKFDIGDSDAAGLIQQLQKEVDELQKELTNQRNKLQQEHAEELAKLKAYFEQELADTEEKWAKELEKVDTKADSTSLGSSLDEPELAAAKRPDFSHSLMTLTHISDTESSPPRSPVKNKDMEAELRQQMRGDLEKEYQKSLENLRNELENEHKAETAGIKLEYELKHEQDLEREKEALKRKHEHEVSVQEMKHLEALDNLRKELDDNHAREIARIGMQAMGETARQMEEEREQARRDYDQRLKEEIEEAKLEMEEKYQTELMEKLGEEQSLRDTMEEKHIEEMEKLQSEFAKEKAALQEKIKEDISTEVAQVLVDSSISYAEETETQREELLKKNDLIAILKQELAETEARTQQLSEEIDQRNSEEAFNQTQQLQEKNTNEIAQLQAQLEEEQAKFRKLQEDVQSGEAPEVQAMREGLVQQYDSQLEMIKTTMNEELETLTKMTQQQSAKDLEEMQAKFVAEHEQMLERFAEDQERIVEEVRLQQEMDMENMKKQLTWQHEQDKSKALEELEKMMEEAKTKEIETLVGKHEQELKDLTDQQEKELEKLKSEYDEKWKKEKAKMGRELEEQLNRFDDAESLLQQLRENHEQEKKRLKEELTTVHMEKFKEVTDKLEEEHQRQLEEVRDETKKEVEEEAAEKLKLVEEALEVEKVAKEELEKNHQEEIAKINENYQVAANKLVEEHEDKLKAVTLDSEKELESAKLELEEAHQKEVLDLQEKLNGEKKKEVDELNNRLTEVTDLMKLEHQQELEQVGNDHQKEINDLITEREKRVEELQQELTKLQEEKDRMQQEHMAEVSGEKGSIDAILRERDEKWQKELQANEDQHQQVLQKLLDEINQVQEEKAALVKRGLEKDTVLARRERENEEANNLISMLRSDLERISSERENLQQVNNHLLQVLSQAVRASIATEDTINKRLFQDRQPEGAVGGDGDDNPPPNTSFQSSYSDEGLDLSQQLAESMFAGPDLDADGEELITNANTRLQASVETLLQRMAGTVEEHERDHASQAEQLQTGPTNQEENQCLRADNNTLQERLKEESEERQRLAQELDRTQGLLQGMQAQTDELQDALKNAEEKQLQVIVDLETANNGKRAAEEECQHLRQQQTQLIGQLEGKERDLADEISRLNQENSVLKNEVDDLLQQAKKDRENFKNQVQLLESSVEEQMAKWEKILEEKNAELDDLQDQKEAADKQLKANKQFLEQQSAEREQERDEFQKEIQRLEGLSGRDRTNNYEEEDIRKELQDTKEELESLREDYKIASDQKQDLEKEFLLKDDTVQELTSQIKELERTLDEMRIKSQPLESQIESMEKELMDLRKLEEELTHEKETLFKQCSDQLLQISALHSKLDANKQGLGEDEPRPMMVDEDDVEKSLASVALMQQLEQEREALERKEKEIKALEEQLDQFRDGLVSKEDEISQLSLQLDIASKAAPEERQAKESLVAENEHLKEQLAALQEKISTLVPQTKSLDGLTQDLLEEKNQQIDELTSQVIQTQEQLEAVKQQLEELRDGEDEDANVKKELEEKLLEKDAEIAALQEQIADSESRDNMAESLVVETLEKVRSEQQNASEDTKVQLEEELRTTKQLLAVREREIAQLEAQLMSLQGSPGRSKNIQEETVDEMQKEMEDKDLQLMQLKIQVDQAEETVFQAQQQLGQLSALPREHQQLQQDFNHLKEKHSKEMKELKKKHKDILATKEAEYKREMEGLLAAQEEDWKKIQQLEKDYEGKISLLGKLSPGKSLQQKLDEIKDELTKQHQEHIADIQRTMSREADERIEQLKAQFTQESQLLQERHQHELEEAILRTNRDLMAAHAEEVAKLREDHRSEVERIMAASPASISQFTDMNQMIQNEIELAQMRGRPSGVSQEIPSQADSGVSSGDIATEGLSEKLKLILTRIKGEGLSLLSLSELRYLHDQTIPRTPLQKGLDVGSLQEAWENEKRALLDAIQALKDLVTQMSSSQRGDLDADGADWRGELLHTIQQVFQCERDALKAELTTNVAMSGDQNITEMQLLQRRIREQENFHKSAVEQIYGADRTSILGESRDLFSQNQALKEELQKSRQRLTQQLKALEDQSNKRERQLKRQLETIEHKFRQERILVEDLRTSLTVEKEKGEQLSEALQKAKSQVEEQQEEISDLLSKMDKQIGDREALESRLADITAAFEAEKSHNRSLNSTLADEKRAARSLHEAFEADSRRVNHARNREQQMIKELQRELQQQQNRYAELQKNMEKEALRSSAMTRELEAIRAETVSEVQHEKAKFTELKTGLELERSRCQELKTALQREQVLNAQLQSSLDKERQENADTSLQEKTTIAELQAKLDSSQAEAVDLTGQIKQLENAIHRMEGVLETERAQNKEAVSRERAAGRQMKSSVDAMESKLEEVGSQLMSEHERSARLKAEKERLQQSLENQSLADKELMAQREKERENEKKKQLEREREREVERQRQRDHELEHQLDQQKIRSLEEQVEEWKNHAQQTLEELQRVQDKQKYENEEDAEMQRELETELQKSLERHSPAGREAGSGSHRSKFNLLREQLEAIRQRLQLIAVKEHEGLALLKRMNQTVSETTTSTSYELHSLERTLQEATAELKQIHGALVLQTEVSTGVPASKSRLNTRLLNQNAELSNYISKLSDEKSEMKRQISQLEEQLWTIKQRHLHQTSSPPRGNRRDLDLLFAEERTSWERERISTQNALRQAEREIIRLKLELEHNASNRESDAELLLSNGDIPEHQQQKFQRLYGKYLRAESFRKSLIYQKKYLLLLLGGFQDTEEASLALIAKMGGYPNPANMEEGSRHSKAFTKFRSAVRVCIAIQRLKYLKRKWQRACGTTNHSSPPSSLSQPPLLPFQRSLPTVYHSSTTGAMPAAPTFLSPARRGTRIGIASSGSPPVRDRVVPGGTNGIVNGADGYTSPHAPYRSNSHSRFRDRLSMSPHDSSEDPEVSLTKYIKKLENLQERIGTGSRRGEQNGSRRQLPNQRR